MDTSEYVGLDKSLRPLGKLLSYQAGLYPDRDFLVVGDRSWTYREFDEWVSQIAGSLYALGLRKGDKLAIMLPNCAEFMGLWFACARLGVIEVPVNINYRGPLLQHILSHSDASIAVVDANYVERIAHETVGFGKLERLVLWSREPAAKPSAPIPALTFDEFMAGSTPFPDIEVSHADTMAILYSSGTTGPSKGIVLCHNYFWFGGSKTVKARGIESDERVYTCLPLFHANAQLLSAMPALVAGVTLVLDDHFSASTFWERLRRYGATRFNYIGGMIPILMKQAASPSDRIRPWSGSSPVSKSPAGTSSARQQDGRLPICWAARSTTSYAPIPISIRRMQRASMTTTIRISPPKRRSANCPVSPAPS